MTSTRNLNNNLLRSESKTTNDNLGNEDDSGSMNYYKAILDNAFDGIGITDAKGHNLYQSPGVKRMFGYTPTERMGKSGFEMMHSDDLPLAKKFLANILKQAGNTERVVARIQHKNGSWIYVETRGTNLLHNPLIKGIVLNYRDITADIEAEKKLKESEAKWDAIIQQTNERIMMVDREGIIHITNQIIPPLKYEDVIGKSIHSFLEGVNVDIVKTALIKVFTAGKPVSYEVDYVSSDNEKFYFSSTASPYYENGVIVRAIIVAKDITASKIASAALKKTEAKWSAIFSAAQDNIVIIDKNGIIIDINRVQQGWKKEDVIGSKLEDTFSAPNKEFIMEGSLKVFDTKLTFSFEAYNEGPDGSFHWYSANVSPIISDNMVTHIAIIMRDVTEIKKQGEELKKFSQALDNSINGVHITDLKGNIEYTNTTGEKIYGYKAGEIVGKNVSVLYPGNDNLTGKITTAIHKSGGWKGELLQVNKEGTIFPIYLSASTILNDQHIPIGMLGIIQDITERKKKEEELIQFSQALKHSINGVHIADLEGIILYSNPVGEKIYGYNAGELTGKHVNEFVPEVHSPINAVIEVIKEEGSWRGEAKQVKKDGTIFPIHLSASIIQNEQGKSIGILGIVQDITESKKKEEKLLMFSQALDQSIDVINIANLDGQVIYSNTIGESLYGYKSGELHGQHVNLFFKDKRMASKEIIPAMQKTGGWTGEAMHAKKDGTLFPVYLSTSMILNKKKEAIGMLGIVRDITERKKKEEELMKFVHALNYSVDGINIVNMEGNIVYSNPSVVKMYGYEKEELTGKHISIFHSNKIYAKEVIIRAMKKEGNWSGEVMMRRKNGSLFPVSLSTSLILNNQSEPIGMMGINRDITEVKKREKELTMFCKAVEQSHEGIGIINLNGVIVKDNDALREIFGYKNSLTGRNVSIFHGTQGISANEIIEGTNKEGRWSGELNLIRENGSVVPVILNSTLIKIDDENIGILAIVDDITESKKVEKEILNAKLEAEDDERKRVAMEIHDGLGQSLFGMQLNIEALERNLTPMADKDKKIIDSTKNTLGEVFKEVRNISRNLLPYPLENTNLIPAIIALCERLSESKTVNIKFLTKIEKIDLKLSVQHALYRVIQELLSNTLRHSKATNIELTLMSDDKEISLQVNDNGTGIRKSLSKGGIGLENIKQRVKFIGGSLEINSILNEGTFVNILVPFDEFVN